MINSQGTYPTLQQTYQMFCSKLNFYEHHVIGLTHAIFDRNYLRQIIEKYANPTIYIDSALTTARQYVQKMYLMNGISYNHISNVINMIGKYWNNVRIITIRDRINELETTTDTFKLIMKEIKDYIECKHNSNSCNKTNMINQFNTYNSTLFDFSTILHNIPEDQMNEIKFEITNNEDYERILYDFERFFKEYYGTTELYQNNGQYTVCFNFNDMYSYYHSNIATY